MSILVIGGTGFIGARLTEHLVQKGEEVVCFDLYPNPEKVSHLGDQVKVVTGDVTRIEHIIGSITEFQVERIINLAAVLVTESEAHLHSATRLNFVGMTNVFEAARLMGINRVVYASSIAAYGVQSSFGDRPITEDDICQPTTAYGAHKLWSEFMARKYMEHHGMSIPGLRIAIVSGPGRKTGISAWSSTYIDRTVAGDPAEIPYRSDQRVLITYVDDTAETFARMCFADTFKYPPVYNSLAYSVSLRELAEAVRGFIPNAEIRFNEDAPDMPLVYSWSSKRLKKEFGLKAAPIEEMIRKHISEVRSKAGLPEI